MVQNQPQEKKSSMVKFCSNQWSIILSDSAKPTYISDSSLVHENFQGELPIKAIISKEHYTPPVPSPSPRRSDPFPPVIMGNDRKLLASIRSPSDAGGGKAELVTGVVTAGNNNPKSSEDFKERTKYTCCNNGLPCCCRMGSITGQGERAEPHLSSGLLDHISPVFKTYELTFTVYPQQVCSLWI